MPVTDWQSFGRHGSSGLSVCAEYWNAESCCMQSPPDIAHTHRTIGMKITLGMLMLMIMRSGDEV